MDVFGISIENRVVDKFYARSQPGGVRLKINTKHIVMIFNYGVLVSSLAKNCPHAQVLCEKMSVNFTHEVLMYYLRIVQSKINVQSSMINKGFMFGV